MPLRWVQAQGHATTIVHPCCSNSHNLRCGSSFWQHKLDEASYHPFSGWGPDVNDFVMSKALFKQVTLSEQAGNVTTRSLSGLEPSEQGLRRDVQVDFTVTEPSPNQPDGSTKVSARFLSRPIRVISKPCKKRQSVRGTESE